MIRATLLAALVAVSAPGFAQSPESPAAGQMTAAPSHSAEPVSAAPLPAPDPARLAAAERVVDRVWPVGTFRRMMESTFAGTMPVVAGQEMATTAWAADDDSKEARRARHEARTGRRIGGGTAEPEPEDAMASFNAVFLPAVERLEPPMRAAIARIYARRYDLTQLGELEAFFSTPTGAAYAADSLTLMSDPEMVAAMQAATMEMVGALFGVPSEGAEGAAAEAAAAAMDAASTEAGPASVNAGVKVE